MSLKKIIVILTFLISFGELFAQGGSNYSILGIGDINYSGNAAYSALAGTQIAFPAEYSINSRNPAMWSFVTNTRLQAGYKFNQNIVSDDNSTLWHNNGALSGFSGIFAIDSSYGTAASFGIVPYSHINYLTATDINVNQIGLELKGKTTYQGAGGISQAYAGVSTKITDWFGVGFSIFSTFGVVESGRETEFNNDFYSFKYSTIRSDYVSGWGFKTGAFISPAKNLLIGLSYEAQPSLSVSSETNYISPTVPDTTITVDKDIEIPGLLGLGFSYSSGNFIFGGDFSIQNFSNFNYNSGANTEFTNSYIASIGINRIGNPSLNANFADRVSYKFGLGYNQLYYKVLGSQIQEYTATVGMQMPFAGSMIVDLSFIFGHRTANDARLVKEYFIKFGIDISMGETWFKPFLREY
jgi:hypothetical protein